MSPPSRLFSSFAGLERPGRQQAPEGDRELFATQVTPLELSSTNDHNVSHPIRRGPGYGELTARRCCRCRGKAHRRVRIARQTVAVMYFEVGVWNLQGTVARERAVVSALEFRCDGVVREGRKEHILKAKNC